MSRPGSRRYLVRTLGDHGCLLGRRAVVLRDVVLDLRAQDRPSRRIDPEAAARRHVFAQQVLHQRRARALVEGHSTVGKPAIVLLPLRSKTSLAWFSGSRKRSAIVGRIDVAMDLTEVVARALREDGPRLLARGRGGVREQPLEPPRAILHLQAVDHVDVAKGVPRDRAGQPDEDDVGPQVADPSPRRPGVLQLGEPRAGPRAFPSALQVDATCRAATDCRYASSAARLRKLSP